MNLVNYKNLGEKQGNLMLIYALAGGHKTCTFLQTAADPIVYLTAEGRKVETSVKPINRPDLKMVVGIYENFDDLIETCMTKGKFGSAKTIGVDSLTHLMVVHLAQEILQENFSSKTADEQANIAKALTMQVKMSEEAYGTLAGQMNRLMRALQSLTMQGYDIVCTARTEDRPKWNRSLSCAPALMGKAFSKSMDGFFDLIGYLEPWEAPELPEGQEPPGIGASLKDTWKYYAPYSSWNPNDDFLAKWTGCMPPQGIVHRKFHVAQMFREANGLGKG